MLTQEQNRILNIIVPRWRSKIHSLLEKFPSYNNIGFDKDLIFLNKFDVKICIKSVMYNRENANFNIATEAYNKNSKRSLTFSDKSLHKTLSSLFLNVNNIRECPDCETITSEFYTMENKCEECLFDVISHEFNENEEKCSICLTDTKRYITLECNHKFHYKCVYKLDKCPICRNPLKFNNNDMSNFSIIFQNIMNNLFNDGT
jgi:hypothetical protein